MPVDATIGSPRNVQSSGPGEGGAAQGARAAALRAGEFAAQTEADAASAALSALNAQSAAALSGSFTTLALANAVLAGIVEGHTVEVTADPTPSNIGIWAKRSGVLVLVSSTTVAGLNARLTAIAATTTPPIAEPEIVFLIIDPTTGRWLAKGRADGSMLGDMRNIAGAVLASQPEAQVMATTAADAVNARVVQLGTVTASPLPAPDLVFLVTDPTTGRALVLGRETGAVEGDFRDRSGVPLVTSNGASALVAAVGGSEASSLDDPGIVAALRDPTTQRSPWQSYADGSTRGDWRNRAGVPIADDARSPIYAAWRLRSWIDRVGRIRGNNAGMVNGISQAVVAGLGDSWSQSKDYYGEQLYRGLIGELGSCGLGWVQLLIAPTRTTGSGITSDMGIIMSAGWAESSIGPAVRSITTSAVGETMTLDAPAGNPIVNLQAGGIGSLRYRFNSGAWTTLALPAAAIGSYALANVPASGAWVCDVETLSGSVTLCGFDLRSATSGLRWNKLGHGGGTVRYWADGDGVDIITGLTALQPNLVPIFFGVNDQKPGPLVVPLAEYGAGLSTIIDRVRAAAPTADILLVSPPAVRDTGIAMSDYSRVMRDVARTRETAHLDMQQWFGERWEQYAYGSNRALLNDTGNHPSIPEGRQVLVEAFRRTLLYASS